MQMRLLREGILTPSRSIRLEKEAGAGGRRGCRAGAWGAAAAQIAGIPRHVYSEDLDPTTRVFRYENRADAGSADGKSARAKGAAPRTMADLINACLQDEMRRDPRIVVYGEDVADASREDALTRSERARAASSS